MKRRTAICLFLMFTLVVTGVFAGGGAQSGSAAQQRKVVMQLGLENHPGEPVTDGVYEWSRLAKQMSGGSLEIEVFPSSQIGTKDQLIDQMLVGMPVITLADGAFFAERGAPDMGITVAPYFFATWDEVWRLIESDWWKAQAKILEDKGLKILTANFVYGDRHTLTTRPIRTVDDFRGLKLRTPTNLIQIKGTEVMGASPTPLPLGDVYVALQQGVIDGVENPLPVLYGGKFHEVAKYLTLDAHIRMITSWFCGTQFFNTLSKQHQDILMESGRQAGLYNNNLVAKAVENLIGQFKAEGVEIIEIDMARFQAQARPFYSMPEFTSIWSPGIVEATNRAKAGR
jgi:tripartite ATP-independent transporter DctP family solute receptor